MMGWSCHVPRPRLTCMTRLLHVLFGGHPVIGVQIFSIESTHTCSCDVEQFHCRWTCRQQLIWMPLWPPTRKCACVGLVAPLVHVLLRGRLAIRLMGKFIWGGARYDDVFWVNSQLSYQSASGQCVWLQTKPKVHSSSMFVGWFIHLVCGEKLSHHTWHCLIH